MDGQHDSSAGPSGPAQGWDIPDTSTDSVQRVRIDRWNQQAWPPITFGVPPGWLDVAVEQFTWLPVERRISPQAPILQDSTILAAVRRTSEPGQAWQVQLRVITPYAMSGFVLDDPVRWSQGRSLVGERDTDPQTVWVGGHPGIRLTYSSRLDDEDLVFAEVWWAHPRFAYYVVASAPAQDGAALLRDLDAMLETVPEQAADPHPFPATAPPAQPPPLHSAGPPPMLGAGAVPVPRYRCAVQTQLPFVLHNVTSEQRRMVVLGSPSTVAWSMIGIAAMAMYGRARASSMEGQVVAVPANGEAVLTDDGAGLHVTAAPHAAGVRLRTDAGPQSVDLQIPYRLVRRWGREPQGIWLDVVGRGAVWLRTSNDDEFTGWLAHLSHAKTWQSPIPMTLTAPTAIVGWCQQDPRFTFAVPQGWSFFNPAAVADYARSFLPDLLCSGVGVDAGQLEVQLLVIDCGPAAAHLPQADPDSLAALLVDGLSPPGPVSLITLGGEPAALARAAKPTPEGVFDRTYGVVAHRGVLFAFWYGTIGGTPADGSHERWFPDFHSILATWHWY